MADPAAVIAGLPQEQLHDWVLEQRWFASKAREVAQLNVLEAVTLREDAPMLVLALVEARFQTGTHELYQLPLGLRAAAEGWDDRVIAEVDGWTVYDALGDPTQSRELLHRIRGSAEVGAEHGILRFRWAESASAGFGGSVDVRPVGVEQSNSSVVFGDELILKVFRRLEPGVNPELELLRFLSSRGFPHIAPLAGWYEYAGRLMNATLGTLQEYLSGARDGWELCLDDLEAFIPRARGARRRHRRAAHVARLGVRRPGLRAGGAEPGEPVAADRDGGRGDRADVRRPRPRGQALAPIAGRAQDVRERLQALSHIGTGGRLIRTHGDYHLGQTMLTDRGWVILDFEGEPARPLPERRRKRSPLRDVAGMLRSFAYAASAAGQRGSAVPERWEDNAREAFLDGYFEARRRAAAAARPGRHRKAPRRLRAGEGGLRAALRAQQPARLGRHPGRRDRAPARGRGDRVAARVQRRSRAASSTRERTPSFA